MHWYRVDVGITDAEGVFRCRYVFRALENKIETIEDAIESDVITRLEARPAPAEIGKFCKALVVPSEEAENVCKEGVLLTSISVAQVWLSVDEWK